MVGKRQHQEEMFEPVLEFKARDGAWYAGTAAFVGPLLRVHFEHFSEEEDERWRAEKFRSPQDVKKMIRPASQPMQDFHCKELRRGVILCVACRHSDSDCFEYYDAKLQQLDRFPHEFLADNQECCRCQFEVEWLGGPFQHRRQFVGCGDICILTPGDIEDDPVIKEFIGRVKSLKAGKTVSKLAGSEASLKRNASWTSKKSRTQHSACSEENEQKRLKTSPGCGESSSQTGFPKDGENPEGSHWRKDASEMNACHYNTKAATKSSEPPYSGRLPVLNEWARELSVRNLSSAKKDSAKVFPSRGGLPDLNDSAKQSSCSEAGQFSTYPAFVGGAQRFSREEDMEDSSSYECLTLRDWCDQESSLHGISPKRKTGTTTNEGTSTNAPRTHVNLADSKCDLRLKSDERLNNSQVPCAVNTDLQHTGMDLKDKYKISHFVALGDSSKVSPSKQKDIINLDSDEEEDLKPLISRMKCLQGGSVKEAFPTQMTPTFDVDSHHRRLNGKEPDTLARQSMPNYIPVEADMANQAVACKNRTDPVMASSNKTRPDVKLGSSKSDYNTSMQSEPLPREMPATSMEKPADPVIVNRLHVTSSMPNKASQQHTSILEEKTPPETKSTQQWPLQSPLVDESSNNDFSGLSKEQPFFQSCMGHISPCSCTAFQSSCYKSRSCHECGAMGFISISPLHLQTSMRGYASSCLCEGHSGCRHNNSFNFTRKSGHYCTTTVCSQGGSKILYSQGGHTMQSQGCEEDEDIKEKPKADVARRKEMLPEDVKVMNPSQFLFIENLEKDITPFKALKIILKVSPGALMVYIWPSLEYETTTKGYICYQDSQAADTAYSNFHAGKFMIISTKGRPWVVSRSQVHILNWNQLYSISAAATLKWEENKEAGMEDIRDANGGLFILFKGTEEYTMALGKQKLFLEQKKELRLCYLRFSNEERELEASI